MKLALQDFFQDSLSKNDALMLKNDRVKGRMPIQFGTAEYKLYNEIFDTLISRELQSVGISSSSGRQKKLLCLLRY